MKDFQQIYIFRRFIWLQDGGWIGVVVGRRLEAGKLLGRLVTVQVKGVKG